MLFWKYFGKKPRSTTQKTAILAKNNLRKEPDLPEKWQNTEKECLDKSSSMHSSLPTAKNVKKVLISKNHPLAQGSSNKIH